MEGVSHAVDRQFVWRESGFGKFVVIRNNVFHDEIDGHTEFVFETIVDFAMFRLQWTKYWLLMVIIEFFW